MTQPDDLMPNDGTYFGGVPVEPQEQTVSRQKEKARTLEALPILKDIVAQLEVDIAFYDSVGSIPKEARLDKEKFLISYNANLFVRNVLISKKEWIEGLIDEHAKNL